jgi:hypothetical protein
MAALQLGSLSTAQADEGIMEMAAEEEDVSDARA